MRTHLAKVARYKEEDSVNKNNGVYKLLIVDDAAALRKLVATLLELSPMDSLTWDVREASNGSEALQAAREFGPHVILLDIRMPGMDGYEVAQCIRNDQGSYGDPALVFMTAFGNLGETEEKAKAAGGDHYLTKPFDLTPEDMQLTLLNVYQRRAGTGNVPVVG